MLIIPYQESWVDDFDKIKNVIINGLKDFKFSVEHVGSTSVENLAAKPIIDIDLVYEENDKFEEIKKGLERLGYFHNGNQGIEGREVFKRAGSDKKHEVLDHIKHHLYVCTTQSDELKRHLVFRNHLRVNERDKTEYEKIKYTIAELSFQDRKNYARLKETMASEFIESVIKRATGK